jgi:hypothetical protein
MITTIISYWKQWWDTDPTLDQPEVLNRGIVSRRYMSIRDISKFLQNIEILAYSIFPVLQVRGKFHSDIGF